MYLSYYKLLKEPFQLTPDPRFLQMAEAHRNALSILFQGVLMRKGFMVLTGPVGTGKTTLLHAVMHILNNQSVSKSPLSTAFVVNPTLTREEFLEFILDEFEVPCASTSKPRRLAALQQMLVDTQRRGSTAVLVIDEAHLLTSELLEEIRLLGNTDSYREKMLQVILSAQPEMHTLLRAQEHIALRQRIAGWCELRPLNFSETQAYITERLHVAGLEQPSPFIPAAVQRVFDHSHGVPRLINLICDQCLILGATAGRSQIDAITVEEALIAMGWEVEPAEGLKVASGTTAAASVAPAPPAENRVEFQSCVDLLIQSMKHRRVAARE
ncbi:MAG: AAA family ATPase [Candidatus Acidiferrum sp.]